MAVFVEGIGGTGKAVINLLKFAQGVAGRLAERSPEFSCAVIDQDHGREGVWEGVAIQPMAGDLSGPFKEAYNIITPLHECAARLLFSDAELRTEVGLGFHGHPKLAAALSRENVAPIDPGQHSTHVLVYSAIGGTGAGLGPSRLEQLLDDPNKTHVIAIVFGKYLSAGVQNPTGHEWLGDRRLSQNQNQRWFFGFYVHVPSFQVNDGAPPKSGLNPTPALLLAVGYIWRLAEAERTNTIDLFLRTNALADARHKFALVPNDDDHAWKLTAPEASDLITRLRECGRDNRLDLLIPRNKQSINFHLRQSLKQSLAPECWKIFQAQQPEGTPPDVEVNWAGLFNDTFAPVPDPWAAAHWFHKAVQAGNPTCTDAFLKLTWLFLQGRLHVFRTDWGPVGGPAVYALSTEPLTDDAQFVNHFTEAVVGGFSRELPFWTVYAFVGNLNRVAVPQEPQGELTIRLKTRSKCVTVYQAPFHQVAKENTPCSVQFESAQRLGPSRWDWAIYFDARDWDGLRQHLNRWELLRRNVELYQGAWTLPRVAQGQREYTCDIRGVHIRKGVLEEDGIFVGAHKGIQYYELRIGENIRRVLGRSVGDLTGQPVADADPVSVLYGNVLMTVQQDGRRR